ncbi:MAG: flagellar hook-associated protein FlgK [Rubrivivax sp.]
MASALLTVGMRTVAANYAALQTTGNNIANANVEGYSRQRVEFSSAQSRAVLGGFVGMGVDVKAITREYDSLRAREATQTQSVAKMDEARLRGLEQIEKVFPVGTAGLGQAASAFLNSLADVVSRPADISARQVALARAGDSVSRFREAAQRLDEAQKAINESVDAEVAMVNQLATGIADVNGRMARMQVLQYPMNDLLDERERLLVRLNELVQTNNFTAQDGSLQVLLPGGHILVNGDSANRLQRVPDPDDSSRSALECADVRTARAVDTTALAGGSLAGWIRVQNEDLVAARNAVGQMAAAFASAVNEQQANGIDLRGVNGGPIFALADPRVVPATTNQRLANGAFAAEVSLTVTDASQLAASDYSLRTDSSANGVWTLTRLSDGLVRSVIDGDEVDGFVINLGSPPPADTDRFLLQPVGAAASSIKRVLDDPRGLAAASPVAAQAASTNTGTGTIESVRATSPRFDPTLAVKIVFTSDDGTYEVRDKNDAVIAPASRQWVAGQPIVIPGTTVTQNGVTSEVDGFELQLNGVPRTDDVFEVARNAYPGSSNGNALAMLNLRDVTFVGRTVDAEGLVDAGRTISDAYASAVGSVGVNVQRARTASEISSGVALQAEAARSEASGVNLEEEAARLLHFQQSYQAGAKVLQAAQSVFDSLLQTLG